MSDTTQGFCVTCPKCGKINHKCFATDSIIFCGRCNYQYYICISQGITIEMPASRVENKKFFNRMRHFISSIKDVEEEELQEDLI